MLRSYLKGQAVLERRMAAAGGRLRRALAGALYQEELAIIAEAVPRIPVDTGRARATAYAAPPEDRGHGTMSGEVGFGTDYAVPLHEDTTAAHVVGEAEFLRIAFDLRSQGWRDRVAARTRAFFRAGGGLGRIAGPTSPQDPGPSEPGTPHPPPRFG